MVVKSNEKKVIPGNRREIQPTISSLNDWSSEPNDDHINQTNSCRQKSSPEKEMRKGDKALDSGLLPNQISMSSPFTTLFFVIKSIHFV